MRIIRQIEEEAQAEGERRARELIADAIQRVASDHVAEITVSVVPLPSDEMKGRIIGRNGRNIRAFEQAAGVDVVVDDTPEAVTISSLRLGPARGRPALDGEAGARRPHPPGATSRRSSSRRSWRSTGLIVEEGEKAAFDAGVPGLHPEIIKKLGRLKFRTSYGQNQLAHAVETAQLAGVIAAELGANVEICQGRRAAARPGQGDGPRGGGDARRHRGRVRPPLRRQCRGGQHHRLPPPRGRPGTRSRR